MQPSKTILVCPLDWGLGHATRMVPLVESIKRHGAHVILAADQRPLAFLKRRFPDILCLRLPGYQPKYPRKGAMAFKLIRDFPIMRREAKVARKTLEKLIKDHNVDIVISDNRYELSSTQAQCIFITHQLKLQASGLSSLFLPFAHWIIHSYIKKFNALWIPDVDAESNLSGVLSHISSYPNKQHRFIGPLSRFSGMKVSQTESIDVLVMLSGPEPHRTLVEEKLLAQAQQSDLKFVFLQGKPENDQQHTTDNIHMISHLEDEALAQMIQSTKIIVCRPGYSSIMDLIHFNKKIIFIPTPGQTEQVYLAKKFEASGQCLVQEQQTLNLLAALDQAESIKTLSFSYPDSLLDDAVRRLLAQAL